MGAQAPCPPIGHRYAAVCDMTAAQLSGHCLCGACRFSLTGPTNWIGHCYCESCRRATAAAFTTSIGQPNGQWQITGTLPHHYESSPGKTRGFCGTCGTPIFYASDQYPDETHFYAALLTRPQDVTPTGHYHADEKICWG